MLCQDIDGAIHGSLVSLGNDTNATTASILGVVKELTKLTHQIEQSNVMRK